MKNTSLWMETISKEENNKKDKFNSINTDILIIGGGLTGLNTAYFLKDSNKNIIIIDKGKIGMGVTSKTTAKITYLQQDIYRKLTKIHGNKIAYQYYKSQKEAINLIKKIIKDNNINCDITKVKSILFANEEKNIPKLNEERIILSNYKERTKEYHDKYIKNGFIVDNTYVFNPLKYLESLKKIISNYSKIYEDTIAYKIKKGNNKYTVYTNNGLIQTDKIIIACHYPFYITPHLFPIKTYIEREYVNASKVNNSKNITAINIDSQLYSIRYYNNYLIYGSNSHRLTNKIDYYNNYEKSNKEFEKLFQTKPQYTWMNQDIISNDYLPFIGRIKNNLYISTAYNTWGMTNSIIGAKIVSDLILNNNNEYIKLFSPRRINIPLIINSFLGLFHYLKAYIEGIFNKNNPHYIKINGITYGIYKDKKGQKHKVKLICPHMKCPLVFNRKENTWDCPCHGSRFDLDGNILETPSTKKITQCHK